MSPSDPLPGPAAAPAPSSAQGPVRVWDFPTRAFHWALAACVLCAFVSAKVGGAAMVWHVRFGYAIAALLLFRLIWGFVGGRWSRFVSFVYSPAALLRYLQGRSHAHEHHEVGHSPLGALSVFALLGWLLLQVGTGMLSDDEIAFIGPLNRFVSVDTGLAATGWHKHFGEWGVIVLVALHLCAIAFYVGVKHKELIGPMLAGDKQLPAGTPASVDGASALAKAAVAAVAAAAVVAAVVLSAP